MLLEKIYPGELGKALDLLAKGKAVNYEGATGVEMTDVLWSDIYRWGLTSSFIIQFKFLLIQIIDLIFFCKTHLINFIIFIYSYCGPIINF